MWKIGSLRNNSSFRLSVDSEEQEQGSTRRWWSNEMCRGHAFWRSKENRLSHPTLVATRKDPQTRQARSVLICSTLQKVISRSPCVRYHALVGPIPSEDDTISPRTSSSIDLLVTQNGEFVVGSSIWEGETLVIVVLVRICVVAHCRAILVVAVALLHRGVDVILRVACAAAGLCTLALRSVSSY